MLKYLRLTVSKWVIQTYFSILGSKPISKPSQVLSKTNTTSKRVSLQKLDIGLKNDQARYGKWQEKFESYE